MRKTFIVIGLCILFVGCKNSSITNKNTEADSTAIVTTDMHNAETSLDYQGTYKGTFPAADCPGIETTLVLNADKTFTQHYSYIDRNTSFNEIGNYVLKDNLLTLEEKEGGVSYYQVGENHLRKLDGDKKVIVGDLADKFILIKE